MSEATMIHIRLDALRRNLAQAQDALNQVRQRREEMRAVWRALYDDTDSIWAASSAVEGPLEEAARAVRYEIRTRGDPKGNLAKALQNVETAGTAMGDLGIRLDEAEELTTRIRNRAVKVPDALAPRLVAKKSIDLIDPLRDELAPVAAGGQPASGRTAEDVIADAWRAYDSVLEKQALSLFAEYVDLIGGLALRDSGWDNDVCEIADELIRRCSMVGGTTSVWYSMTVPAGRAAMEETLARIIRLGFPEWTIWAVPLGVHEFGHVVVMENREALDIPKRPRKGDDALLPHYLADVFATYALGPSYACAAILLRFDPGHPSAADGSARPRDANRAAVVLRTLERMNKGNGYYTDLITRLTDSWVAASRRRDPKANAVPADPSVADAVKRMWGFLDSGGVDDLYFSGERWLAIQDWHTHLTKEGGADAVEWSTKHEVRDLLSAAWDARSRSPAKADVIEAEVHDLWAKMRSGGGPPQPSEIRGD